MTNQTENSMELVTDKEKLSTMIDTESVRGRALNLLLINGPLTAAEMASALDMPVKSLVSNLNTIKQDATYIKLSITKGSSRKSIYELVGLYKSMRYARMERAARPIQPIGSLEQSYKSAFSLMNTL